MSKNVLLIALTLSSTMMLAGRMPVAGADDEPAPVSPEEKVLKDKGLTRDDRKFLLDEGPALEKYEDARSLYAEYQKALSRHATIVDYDQNVQNMQMEQQTLQQQVNELQMQINSAGSNAGRMQRYCERAARSVACPGNKARLGP